MEFVVQVGDRDVAGEDNGDPQDRAVFLLHGTPGSRIGPRPRTPVLYRHGIRLITYDRPGYGKSTSMPKRQVKDAARDVEAIADHLGIERFAVVGRSGGAPHALACAALLESRVTRCASLVSLAPYNAEGLDWYLGMAPSNVEAYQDAHRDNYAKHIERKMQDRREPIAGENGDPEHLLRELDAEWRKSDRAVVSDPGIRRLLRETYEEALRGQADGWVEDVLAFTSDWGFDPAQISPAVEVLLYHGADDIYSPASHSIWLHHQIKHSELRIERGAAHFENLRRLPPLLSWAADWAEPAARL